MNTGLLLLILLGPAQPAQQQQEMNMPFLFLRARPAAGALRPLFPAGGVYPLWIWEAYP